MNEINSIIKYIKEAPKIALFHHVNPDGDSLSCSYGLLLALKLKFPNKKIVLVGNKEAIKTSFSFLDINYSFFQDQIDDSYLAIIGDTSVSDRIDKYEEFAKAKHKICFDHHQNNRNIDYDVFWKAPTYSASSMQAFEIVKSLDVTLDEESSFFLLIGLLTDTGNFTFSLADSLPPFYYSELLKNVSDKTMNDFFNNFRNRTIEDIEMQKEFLNSIKFFGKVAYVVFDKKQVTKYPDIKNKQIVNLIGNIEGYPIWGLFIHDYDEQGQEVWKLHFRSNGPQVSNVAIELGGGGHHRAAGATVPTSIRLLDVVKKLNSL